MTLDEVATAEGCPGGAEGGGACEARDARLVDLRGAILQKWICLDVPFVESCLVQFWYFDQAAESNEEQAKPRGCLRPRDGRGARDHSGTDGRSRGGLVELAVHGNAELAPVDDEQSVKYIAQSGQIDLSTELKG